MFMVLNEDLGSYETTQKTMRKKILLVDDSPFFLKALSDALSVDFHVETASSGEKAINLLEEIDSAKPGDIGPFDLVITDLEMTGLSGYDVSQFIRNKNRRNKFIPVIILTGKDITQEEARGHGCAAYIPKTNLGKVVSMTRILLLR
ncbi:MAG: response regulator [Desulfuromonadales bacterium]|nr:response regulator [Desulfuromonadales bacterium]MDH3870388.1 response regulator [Desulfuromonadales bacterium]MDH3961036.1 response regulator [Desulfuromonadales bacterium]MDH4024085.1 response regulator [Desulfuromonadales bacterium]